MTTTNKNKTTRGRGRGKTPNRRYSLLARYPDRPSERSIVQVCGREQDTLEERHRNLLEMERYCYTHDLLYRWFLASPFQEEGEAGAQVYVLYLTIEHTPKAWNNVRSQVSRLGLTSKRVSMLPIAGETVAPEVQEQEQEREEVQA